MGRILAEFQKPASWQDFDRLSRSLMSAVHGVQFERWGPPDHREQGADAWARLPNGKVLLLQCKGRSRNFGRSLSIANLDAAVREIDNYPHEVEELMILTTTHDNVALQDRAEELSALRAAAGLSRVSLYGWHSIVSLMARHDDALQAYLRPRRRFWRYLRWGSLLFALLVASLVALPRFS